MRLAKFVMVVTLVGIIGQGSAFAICDKNLELCGTVTAGVAGGTGATIYTLSKYKAVKSFDQQNTQVLMDMGQNPQRLDEGRVSRLASGVAEGDRVIIEYRLSEAANRDHHAAILTSKADSEISSAASYRSKAIDALIPKTEVETVLVDGKLETRKVVRGPSLSKHLYYSEMADEAERDAQRLYREIAEVRAGNKSVPWYNFSKEIAEPAGNQNTVRDFMNRHAADGGSVLKVTRLEAQKLAQLKKMIWKARGGVVGVVGAGAFVAEELVAGKVAESLSKKSKGIK